MAAYPGALSVPEHQPVAPDWWRSAGIVAGTVVAVAAVVGALVAHLWAPPWEMIDLAVYRWGATQVLTDQYVYGPAGGRGLPFTYTPAAALAFVPISLVPAVVAQYLVIAANAAAVFVLVRLTLRELGYRPSPATTGMAATVALVSLALEPLEQNVFFGQVNVVLAAVILADMLLPDDHRWKGVGVGIAAGLKLTPALFAVYLFVTGRRVPALRAFATFLVTVAVGWLFLPRESDAFWVGRLFADPTRVGGPAFVGNQSINGLLARTLERNAVGAWTALTVLAGVAGLTLAWWEHRAHRELSAVLVCAFTGLLISPISWTHHWVWVAPVLVWLVHRAVRGGSWWWPATLVVFLVWPGWIWLLPRDGDVEFTWGPWEWLLGNSYVLITVAGLVGLALTRVGETPSNPAEPEDLADLLNRRD